MMSSDPGDICLASGFAMEPAPIAQSERELFVKATLKKRPLNRTVITFELRRPSAVAERVGFEPTVGFPTPDFESGPL